MAFTSCLPHQVHDLTLAKPPLPCLPLSSSVSHALRTLKHRRETELPVWDCIPECGCFRDGSFIHGPDASHRLQHGDCRCVGKVCMQKIVCYLCVDESLKDLAKALSQPLSVLFTDPSSLVQHIASDASIQDALRLIVNGVQNLVVPIERPSRKLRDENSDNLVQKARLTDLSFSTRHNGIEYCWLTHEDVMRFLVGFVSLFSPLPVMSIKDLGVIDGDILMVEADKDAISALDMIIEASTKMTAVAVVEDDGQTGPKLIGEISSSTLQTCDETAALALATLTARDFVLYAQDSQNPNEEFVKKVTSRTIEKLKLLKGNVSETSYKHQTNDHLYCFYDHEMEASESSSEEEQEDSPRSHHHLSWKYSSMRSSTRLPYLLGRFRLAPIVCHPWSSLIAVLLQALAHRENYVWVINEEGTLVGIVTFAAIAGVLFEHLNGRRLL